MNTLMLIRCAEKKSGAAACKESLEYVELHPDPVEAWGRCERGDWLLWAAEHAGVDRRQIARATADIAEVALQRHWPADSTDRRPHEAIEVLRRWIAGEATDEGLRAVATVARAAVLTAWASARETEEASACAAAEAADGVSRVVEATSSAAGLADAASWAAWAAARAARAASWAAVVAARADSLRVSAEIVRRYLSIDDVIAAIGGAE